MNDKSFSIMIIDDEPSIRNGIKAIIEKEIKDAYVPALAKDAQDGFNKIKGFNPDLIISDIVMPSMTGLELVKKIRQLGFNTPVILISGYDDFAYAQEAIKLGVSAYILKPISRSELITTILKEKDRVAKSVSLKYSDEAFKVASNMFLERLIRGEVKSEEEALRGIKAFRPDMKEGDKTVVLIDSKERFDMSSIEPLASFNYSDYLVLIMPGKEQYSIHSMRLLIEQNTNLLIGVGCSVNQFYQLTKSYQSALLALSYSIYSNGSGIFTQTDISNEIPRMTTGDIDTGHVKALLISKDEKELESWVDGFILSLLNGKTPPPNYIKGMCIFFLNDLMKRLSEASLLSKKYLQEASTASISHIANINELKDILIEKLKYLMNVAIPDSMIENDSIIHRARQMVLESHDKLIKSGDIAEKLGMNPSYFSVYFKNKTGENFRDFANRVKIEEGKKLLIESDLSVEDIALSLGYSDYRSFNRIFRSQTGMTPSEFRKE